VCLGIPGKVIEIYEANGLRMGKVDFGGGVIREACLAYVPEVVLGDYTIIHVGFAISRIDEEEAFETLALLAEMDLLGDELPELADKEQSS
jgi:hydrogenase expression/formation protein HypC